MQLLDPAFAPFTIALILVALIALLEAVSLTFGAPASAVLDDLLPDADADIDLSTDTPDAAAPGVFDSFLGWLGAGRVPMLILLAAFLLSYGVIGVIAQSLIHGVFGAYVPALIAGLVAFPLALFPTRWLGRAIARLFPKEESEAVSRGSFIGKIAIILRGEAMAGRPAEAKLKDTHGATHYLLVEPDEENERFVAGNEVLIVGKAGAVFRAIPNPSPALIAG
jgi:hypothetical protein